MEILPSEYLAGLREALGQIDLDAVHQAAVRLDQARQEYRTIFIIGNGGSAATASHLTNDLNKLASEHKEPKFRALCLMDSVTLLTAWANDEGYDQSVRHFLNFAIPGDVLVAISTSGQSQNILAAAIEAKARGIHVVALVGNTESYLAEMADIVILTRAPRQTQQEDVALAVCHMLAEALR